MYFGVCLRWGPISETNSENASILHSFYTNYIVEKMKLKKGVFGMSLCPSVQRSLQCHKCVYLISDKNVIN